MGLFDFLNSASKSPSDPEDAIISRWEFLGGVCRDALRGRNEIAWRTGSTWFELWFQGLERRTAQSLGRRLAHAAVEHEEYMLGLGRNHLPKGRNPDSWNNSRMLWETSGLGRFSLLEDGDEALLFVEKPASVPICAGIIAASWEESTGKRHRFLWNEGAEGGLVVTMSLEETMIPKPAPLDSDWHISNIGAIRDAKLGDGDWQDLRVDSPGQWSIMGERRMFVHLDLLQRFEEYCLPYMNGIHEGSSECYVWKGIEHRRSNWWTAAADSARERFVSEGHHVLIRDHSDWPQIVHRHLSRHGLGEAESAIPVGDNGGVIMTFSSMFHPAISGGILLGCWERAFGRNGKVLVLLDDDKITIEILPSREIS